MEVSFEIRVPTDLSYHGFTQGQLPRHGNHQVWSRGIIKTTLRQLKDIPLSSRIGLLDEEETMPMVRQRDQTTLRKAESRAVGQECLGSGSSSSA
jgi:hypothetical protein